MSVKEVHNDSEYLLRCTHDYADGGLILKNKSAHFKICGVTVGVAIYNDTDGSNGLVTVVEDSAVTCTLAGGVSNTWTNGDQASIYKTATKDSFISAINTDRSKGWKVTKKDQLDEDGFFPEDADLDRHDKNVFGPGQPETKYKP
jgi:hypothetical protein